MSFLLYYDFQLEKSLLLNRNSLNWWWKVPKLISNFAACDSCVKYFIIFQTDIALDGHQVSLDLKKTPVWSMSSRN